LDPRTKGSNSQVSGNDSGDFWQLNDVYMNLNNVKDGKKMLIDLYPSVDGEKGQDEVV
jgi:hypothetical protein